MPVGYATSISCCDGPLSSWAPMWDRLVLHDTVFVDEVLIARSVWADEPDLGVTMTCIEG